MKAVEKLFRNRNIYDIAGTKEIFHQALLDNIRYNNEHCEFYHKLLEKDNFSIEQLKGEEDYFKITIIPASFFKYHKIFSTDSKTQALYVTSSGTQGQHSQMVYDKQSYKLGVKMFINCFVYHKLFSPIPTNYIMLGYEPNESNSMGAIKSAMGATRFAPALHREFALRSVGDDYELNTAGIVKSLKKYYKMKLPIRFIGFPAYMYFLVKELENQDIRLKLNRGSKVLLGGGWKGFESFKIDKEELYSMIEDRLGISPCNCVEFYSAVEHSIAYADCKNGHFHVPIWSRVIIRDVKTLEPVPYGTPGFLSFITPLFKSAPLTSIMMGDLAVMYEGKKCGCGIKTPYFEVLGRAGTSMMRNCAVSASEVLNGGANI